MFQYHWKTLDIKICLTTLLLNFKVQTSLSYFWFHSLGPQKDMCCFSTSNTYKTLLERSLKNTFIWPFCAINLPWQNASQLFCTIIKINKVVSHGDRSESSIYNEWCKIYANKDLLKNKECLR